jgi:Uma2 family endonuclease
MTASQSRIPYTYEDYRTLPEDMSRRYELLHGELYMVPAPTTRHQRILGNLYFELRTHAESRKLGEVLLAPVDVILGHGSAREVAQPDMIFIAHARREIVKPHGIEGAPDLVVEVLSPGTAERDRGYKRTLYARHDVREYWIVDPDARTVEVNTPGPDGYTAPTTLSADAVLTSVLFPGLEIPLRVMLAD